MTPEAIRAECAALEKHVGALEELRIDLWDRLMHLRRVVCTHPERQACATDPRPWRCADCGLVGETKE